MKDAIGVTILGIILGCMFGYGLAHGETYQINDAKGYSLGTIQTNGNQVNFVSPMGHITQSATLYPSQIVITNANISNHAIVIGTPSYTVPPSPPVPMTPRVMQ